MANVLNRTTKQYLVSVNTPDYPVEDWIINPDMSSVEGWDSQYWVITGDAVSLLSQSDREALDASAELAKVQIIKNTAKAVIDGGDPVTKTVLEAMGVVIQREIRGVKSELRGQGNARPEATIDDLKMEMKEVIDNG